MSSQVRAGRFKGVENRGVADMPRSGESLRFVDQHHFYLKKNFSSLIFMPNFVNHTGFRKF